MSRAAPTPRLLAQRLLAPCLVALALSAAHAQAQAPIRDGAFVEVTGTDFTVDGAPFHVIGANTSVMHGPAQRRAMAETLGAAAEDSMNVVRIWALGEYPADAPRHVRDYAFRVGEEGWVETSFAHLDAVLTEARRLGLRVIVVLANRWGDYGGVTQYLRWSGATPARRSVSTLGLSAFWECEECEGRYRAHVARVVERHRDNPTVFAWELMNEAEAAGSIGEAALLRWVERQAAFVRSLDPNHLIAAGPLGYTGHASRRTWRAVCALDDISYCDHHAYPFRVGRVRSPAGLYRWVDDRAQLALHVVGKPLLFGELGIRTDRQRVRGQPRAAWYRRFFARALFDGAAGGLVWTYTPAGVSRRRRPYVVYVNGPRARQTRDIRRAMARIARRARRRTPRARNRRLGPSVGDSPVFDMRRELRGAGEVHGDWRATEGGARSLLIDPRAFVSARFEAPGVHAGDPGVAHFHGAGAGHVRYRFVEPSDPPAALTIRLRVSSELPGSGGSAGEADTSGLSVWLDGAQVGALVAPPDDGLGRWMEVEIDAATLAALPARRVRSLRVEADGTGAGGLCLYAADETGARAGIELLWTPRVSD